MSDATGAQRGRDARAAAGVPRLTRNYSVAAQGENVVLVDGSSGRSWALASDGGKPVWQPIAFKGSAERAPRGE